MYIPKIQDVTLNPRPAYDDSIITGSPKATGRIVSLSEDRRVAHVIWHGTPGAYRFEPDPKITDTGYVVKGRVIIRQEGKPDLHLEPGSLVEFPQQPFEFEIVEPFTKHSVLHHPDGLSVQVEPL